MQDPTDEEIGRILFSEETVDEERLSENQRESVNALRRLDGKIREMLDFDPTVVEPAKESLPDYLRARLERELETALQSAQRSCPEELTLWRRFANLFSVRQHEDGADRTHRVPMMRMKPQWAAVALALFVCLLVPLALWNRSNRGGEDYSIKSTDAGGEVSTVLLTPGSETGFTTPRVIWFSSKQRAARIRIRSLELPTREWVSDSRGGELAWSDFSPSAPLNAGKKYRLEILVDGKPIVTREFKVSADANPLEIREQEDPSKVVEAAEQLREEGRLRDALMRLGSVTETLRSRPVVRKLREAITAEILAEEKK